MRDTCLRCENEGQTTRLIITDRGGICPVHEPTFLQTLIDNAKIRLGIPLELEHRGTARPNRQP